MKKYTEAEALALAESLAPLQEKDRADDFPCPRCGYPRMHRRTVLNALSRHAQVHVCEQCGADEALRDMTGQVLPITDWGMVRGFAEGDDSNGEG